MRVRHCWHLHFLLCGDLHHDVEAAHGTNIVIGGAAGAFPPVIGWVAATGISLEPLVFFLIIFIWTPPHFWALALVKNDDYRAANIPMLPVISVPMRQCAKFCFIRWRWPARSCCPICWAFPECFTVGAGVASAIFVGLSLLLAVGSRERRNRIAGMVFAYYFLPFHRFCAVAG